MRQAALVYSPGNTQAGANVLFYNVFKIVKTKFHEKCIRDFIYLMHCISNSLHRFIENGSVAIKDLVIVLITNYIKKNTRFLR